MSHSKGTQNKCILSRPPLFIKWTTKCSLSFDNRFKHSFQALLLGPKGTDSKKTTNPFQELDPGSGSEGPRIRVKDDSKSRAERLSFLSLIAGKRSFLAIELTTN